MRPFARTRLPAVLATLAITAGCLASASPDATDGPVIVAGGGTAGVYYSYGSALAEEAEKHLNLDADVLETGGSVENLQRLSDGTSTVGLTAADAAADAVLGQEPFATPQPIRAVARVYDDFVHLVVPADSAVDGIEDLRDHPVSLGAQGSGTEVIARRLLATAGIEPESLDNAELGINASIEALRAGEIEAFFWSGGLSTPGLHELADEMPLRLLQLGPLVDHVSERYGHVYRHAIIPRGTYGMDADVATMAVPNYLVTHEDVHEDLVHDLLELLFEHRSELAQRVEAVGALDRRRAIFTEPVVLHDGALRYYRDTKE